MVDSGFYYMADYVSFNNLLGEIKNAKIPLGRL